MICEAGDAGEPRQPPEGGDSARRVSREERCLLGSHRRVGTVRGRRRRRAEAGVEEERRLLEARREDGGKMASHAF